MTPLPPGENVIPKTQNELNPRSLTREELYSAINRYPRDTWKGSPEFSELVRRISTMPVAQLEAEGYSIPKWKYDVAAVTNVITAFKQSDNRTPASEPAVA